MGNIGSGDGQHFGFAVAQQQAEGPQVVGRAVGVDDDMIACLARMGLADDGRKRAEQQ